ncbi:unnamed protein product [Bursaphelenchus xylophilus]|uniref:mRNA cap guanine-N(7) methyltransferase n=1 Tax=Bursaphelenchus xylophilus TaxID=6326 RepID=A0A1I7SEB0_BURXY|nr:unnamed protein product [Bursaphelenchus xylophilus]CAG9087409.1 unnamed protein product [Bursaphelenchus xylophilus]
MSSQDVANHYNAIPNKTTEDRRSSKIIHLRNYNNWMKSMLIARFIKRLNKKGIERPSVLDLCCGKGGDLSKWKVSNIKEIVMTDVAAVSVEHAKDRYKETIDRMRNERRDPFNAQFVVADAGKECLADKYEPKERLFDLASCMFALHYQFADEKRARKMIENITERLRPGGYFIGILTDPDQIINLVRNKGADNKYKNEVCSVTFENFDVHKEESKIPLFGAKLYFALDEVVNCPEYFAKFALLKQMMKENGMELVYTKPLNEGYKDFIKKGEHFRLFKRMNALEAFGRKEMSDSDGHRKEYSKAYSYLNEHPEQEFVGTLSRSEWEVISMYRVFAFKKTDPNEKRETRTPEPEISEDEEPPARDRKRRNQDEDDEYYKQRRQKAH